MPPDLDWHLAPDAGIEPRRKGRQQRYNEIDQTRHDEPLVVLWFILPACFPCPISTSSGTKVQMNIFKVLLALALLPFAIILLPLGLFGGPFRDLVAELWSFIGRLLQN
jgi:hypothetical protein